MIKLNVRKRSAQTHFPIGNPNKSNVVLPSLGRAGIGAVCGDGGEEEEGQDS